MFDAKSSNYENRFFRTSIAFVLAATLLQASPAVADAGDPNLYVNLIPRADDVSTNSVVVSLEESSLSGTSPGVEYRLDLDIRSQCGYLEHIDKQGIPGVSDPTADSFNWNEQADYFQFVGTASALELALRNVRISRTSSGFGLIDCEPSIITAFFMDLRGTFPNSPQGAASYYISESDSFPLMSNPSQNPNPTSPRLNKFSDGFEIEWDEYLGTTGFTPAGYAVRYRTFDGSTRGSWNYVRTSDGRFKSLLIGGLSDNLVNYEFQAAPTVQTCSNEILYGKFTNIPMVGSTPLDQSAPSIYGQTEQTTGHDVVSQCDGGNPQPSSSQSSPSNPLCSPTQQVAFDGSHLATVYRFAESGTTCDWTVPDALTSGTFDVLVVGGGGGGGADGGGGGGGGESQAWTGNNYVGSGDTWSIQVGAGGSGAGPSSGVSGGAGGSSMVSGFADSPWGRAIGGGGGGAGGQSATQGSSGGDGALNGESADGGNTGSNPGGAGTSESGGAGANGYASGFTFFELSHSGGGGGGAYCADINSTGNYGGASHGGAYGGSCASNNGANGAAATGGGGGGGAGDGVSAGGAGGDGGSGVVYVIHLSDTPLARYLPNTCVNSSGVCSSWEDTTSNPNLTATVSGTPSITQSDSVPGFGSFKSGSIDLVQGTPNDSIVFPVAAMPNNYTLFTVARYNQKDGGSYNRIFDGLSNNLSNPDNWFSGFWRQQTSYPDTTVYEPQAGLAYHNGWLTDNPVEANVNRNFNWVISTDQQSLYRSNGATSSSQSRSLTGPQLTINGGDFRRTESYNPYSNIVEVFAETSDFQVAEVMTFDRQLSEAEYSAVESYLGKTYGICVSNCVPPTITTASSLSYGVLGSLYSATIAVSDEAPVSFSIDANSNPLPGGLNIDDETGVISGTPTEVGTFAFDVLVTNLENHMTAVRNFTFTIYSQAPSEPVGCEDYRNADFVPDNFILDSNGYPIGCDMTGQESVTPQVDNQATEEVETWSDKFNSNADTDFFNLRNGWKCDDCSVGLNKITNAGNGSAVSAGAGLPLGFEFNYYGMTYDSVFVNSNGSLTFGAPSECYDEPLSAIIMVKCGANSGSSAIVPFGVDLDNSSINPDVWENSNGPIRHTEFFYWGKTQVDGRDAFVATWMNSPGYCGNSDEAVSAAGYEYETCDFDGIPGAGDDEYQDTLSTFQIVLIDRSGDEGNLDGDSDVLINYGSILDSQNGYTFCNEGPEGPGCPSDTPRHLAAGLGTAYPNMDNPDEWDISLSSLEALDGPGPSTILFNGLEAQLTADGAPYALSTAMQTENSLPGQFVYQFRSNTLPEVASLPSAPIATLENATSSTIDVTIEPPTDNGGSPIVSYRVEYRLAGESRWTVAASDFQIESTSSTYVLEQLDSISEYEVRVSANNGIGDSPYTVTSSLTTLGPAGVPNIPTFDEPFSINPIGYFEVYWNALLDQPDTYALRYRPKVSVGEKTFPWESQFVNGGLNSAITSILKTSTEYEFQIAASNINGFSGWSDSATATASSGAQRSINVRGISWHGYEDQIGRASSEYALGETYDGALKVFIGQTRETAEQINCSSGLFNAPGFDSGVEVKQSHREWETSENRVQAGYSVVCKPYQVTIDGKDVSVTLSRLFFTESPWTRVMVEAENLETTDLNASIWVESALSEAGTDSEIDYAISSTSPDPTGPVEGDQWIVTGDSGQHGMVVAHVFDTPLVAAEQLPDQSQNSTQNSDGSRLFSGEFDLFLPGDSPRKDNAKKLSWYDGIVQYGVLPDAALTADNYESAIVVAADAAEELLESRTQLSDVYPRFSLSNLSNFRMPSRITMQSEQLGLAGLYSSSISGIGPQDAIYELNLAAYDPFNDAGIALDYKLGDQAKGCISDDSNAGIFIEDSNLEFRELANQSLTVVGTQANLSCFLSGLSLIGNAIPETEQAILVATVKYESEVFILARDETLLDYASMEASETAVTIEAGNATWVNVGSGISDVQTRSSRNAFDEGSVTAYWVSNIGSDPVAEGIKISCPETNDLSYSEVTVSLECPSIPLVDGLTAQITRNFANSDPWAELTVRLTNTNSSVAVSGAIAYVVDLGSDSATEIEMTSDGDLNLEGSDQWFVSSDGGERTDPAILHYFGSVQGQRVSREPTPNQDRIWVKKPVSIAGSSNSEVRFLEGVVDAPRGKVADSVVTAMRAADHLSNETYDVPRDGGDPLNILEAGITAAIDYDRELPVLHTVYECRDYGRNALGPVVLQSDGKPIGCANSSMSSGEGGGGLEINDGLYPGDQSATADERLATWENWFTEEFPNAAPRLGWACDDCVMTSQGAIAGQPGEIAPGLPLGFSFNLGGEIAQYQQQEIVQLDSIRILPQGVVELNTAENPLIENSRYISAFGNMAMGNGALEGNWDELPEYDFFYWGRTVHNGNVAFVVTWVKMPTLHGGLSPITQTINGVPSEGLTPSTMQLMLVSDQSYENWLDGYRVDSQPDLSDVDIIWNFDELQPESAYSFQRTVDVEDNVLSIFSGLSILSGDSATSFTPLIGDANISGLTEEPIGQTKPETVECDTSCRNAEVTDALVSNHLNTSVTGRYVMGVRDYLIQGDPAVPLRTGFFAPATPNNVRVERTSETDATLEWEAPTPWVLDQLAPDGSTPNLKYRIEYAEIDRGEYESFTIPANQESPALDPVADQDGVYAYNISELAESTRYVFRVVAVYSGFSIPSGGEPNVFTFAEEVRSPPGIAAETFDSNFDIQSALENLAGGAATEQPLALATDLVSEGVTVTNATVNGSEFVDALSGLSVGTFEGGGEAVGMETGIVIAPYTDVRAFEKGSSLTNLNSQTYRPTSFVTPTEREKFGQINSGFNEFLQTQQTWKLGSNTGGAYETVIGNGPGECYPDSSCGLTALQFDVLPTDEYLKFEFAMAGNESGDALYEYPDGFGLFVGDIDQSSSCALIPQVGEETPEQRYISSGNAMHAGYANSVKYNSGLLAETITSRFTCSVSVMENLQAQQPVTVTMAIANLGDEIISPAVFIKSGSVRFESTSINTLELSEAHQGEIYSGALFELASGVATSWTATGLPAGLSVRTSESGQAEISGIPSENGNFDFMLEALDENSQQIASQSFTMQVVYIPAQLSCQDSPTGDELLQVLMLSKAMAGNAPSGNGTDVEGADTILANVLCRSSYLATSFFDGADGSSDAWLDALSNADVLVIPGTTEDLLGSELMSVDAAEALSSWVSNGGRVIFADGANHVTALAALIDVNPENLSVTSLVQSDIPKNNDGAPKSASATLPLDSFDHSSSVLVVGQAAMSDFYSDESHNRDFVAQYGIFDYSDFTLTRQISAATFELDRGQVSFLSSSFKGNRSIGWDRALLHSIYGTFSSDIFVNEADMEWWITSGSASWMEPDNVAEFSLGYLNSSTKVECLNTPSRPTIRIVNESGTRILCGSYLAQDGITDSGATLQLERFFSSSSKWAKSTLHVTNTDTETPYENNVVFGGTQLQGSGMSIEATSHFPSGTSNIGSYLGEYPWYSRDTWTVTSAGSEISTSSESWNPPVVVQVFGQPAAQSYGGPGRESWQRLRSDDLKSIFDVELAPMSSESFSFFTGVVPFNPGCDRTAVSVAKQAAIDLQATFDDELNEADGWVASENQVLPSLTTSQCSSLGLVPTNVVASNNSSNDAVVLDWDQVVGATDYEIRFRTTGEWSNPTRVGRSADSRMSAQLTGLTVGTDYQFLVRALRINSNTGDLASGPWIAEPVNIRTASPSPTPTPSPSPSTVSLKIQATPKVPASLKVKKTIKFAMVTNAKIAMAVSSSGKCKTTKILTKKKVGKKMVTTQTGWLVTATAKGPCSIKFTAKGNSLWKPLSSTVKTTVK